MIITLLALVAIAATFHKFVMKAVNSYEYDNTPARYENRAKQMYWDVIKDPAK